MARPAGPSRGTPRRLRSLVVPPHGSTSTGVVLDATVVRVLVQIERRLHEPIAPEELAALAGLSLVQLRARIRAETGEALARHIRRLRLERAKVALKYTPQPVIEIALASGFQSHEGFTRAFRRAYGLAPANFRGAIIAAAERSGAGEPDASGLAVRFVERPALRVAFVRYVGERPQAWRAMVRLFECVQTEGSLDPRARVVGIHYDNDAIADPRRLRYDAGVEVGPEFRAGDRLAIQELPAGLDAVVSYRGPLPGLEALWKHFVERWLIRSETYAWRDDRFFDVYHGPPAPWLHAERVAEATRTGIDVELHIPVSPGAFSVEPGSAGWRSPGRPSERSSGRPRPP